MKPPRIPAQTRQGAAQAVRDALDAQGVELTLEVASVAAGAAVDAAWSKLVGDARDRTATVLNAARALLEAQARVGEHGVQASTAEDLAAKRRGLERALDDLDHPAAWPAGAKGPKGSA